MPVTDPRQTILVTGAAGYIGSHTVLELLCAGFDVVAVDNYSNSTPESLRRVQELAGRTVHRIDGDIRDAAVLGRTFARPIDAVVHFAALKAVGESMAQPLDYYSNNVGGTLALMQACARASVRRIVFSSSATVYGSPEKLPLTEEMPLAAVNPYGATKLMIERILSDACAAQPRLSVVSLRYFNPIGAHSSGRIGEDPRGVPNNLFPYLMQVAIGRRDRLIVFGDDWPTVDGTGVRDYIHVVDLARGHLRALKFCSESSGFHPINLGTGRGCSVLELIQAAERVCGKSIPYSIAARRPGDIAACWADANRALELLGWKAEFDLDRMCADGWRWQHANPDGYRDPAGHPSFESPAPSPVD